MADRAEVVFTFRDASPAGSGGGAGGSSETKEASKAAKSAKESAEKVSKIKPPEIVKEPPVVWPPRGSATAAAESQSPGMLSSIMSKAGSYANPYTIAATAIVGLGLAAKKASDALRTIGQQVGQYSPMVMAGRVAIDQKKIEQDRQRARRFGGRIARQEEVDAKMERALTELKDDFVDFLSPLGELYTEVKSFFADAIGWLAGVEKNTRKDDNPFKAIDGLFVQFQQLPGVADQLRWLAKNRDSKGASGNLLNGAGIKINGLPAGVS